MSPVQARKPLLQPKGPLFAGSSTKCREEKSRGAGRRKSSSPPPAPSRLSRVLRARRQRRARSSQSPSSTEPSSSRQTSPSPSPSERASTGASTTDTTLITGGTTIWSCSSVIVNMSGANAASESPAGTSSSQSPRVNMANYPLETYETSCEVYRRHMALRKKGRHPLWIPQPNLHLPLEYRRRGTQVGDVGIITEDGAFDFMFNICAPVSGSTDSLNLPAGFQPIYPPISPEKEVVVLAEHSARDALTSRGISKQVLPSGEFVFTCTQPNGAILVLPDGAVTERLLNYTRFQQYYAQNAEAWYAFARETRGPDVQNGDLHLVYGCDKATEWGMISFDNPHRGTQLAELRFRNMGEDWRDMVGTSYTWEHTDDAEGRVGPRDRETYELGGSRGQPFRNQTLFIQTVNTTLGEAEWQRITGSVTLDVCTESSTSGPSTAAPRPGSISPTESPPNVGYSSQAQYHTTHNARTVPSAQRYLPSAPRMQPSKVLNEYLLSQFPGAKVAATASDIWSHVEDDCLENQDTLVAAVLAVYSPTLDVDGVASFASDSHIDEFSGSLLQLEHLALVPYARPEVQHGKHSKASSSQSSMSTILIHRRKELHGSPTKLLLHRPPGPGQDEALQPLQIEAPKKRKRSKREMLVERIREQAEEIARLMIKLDNAETMSSEFEGRGGADTGLEGDFYDPREFASEQRGYDPGPQVGKQQGKHSEVASSYLSTFSALIHGHEYLQGGPTAMLSDQSPYHDGAVKNEKKKRDMPLKQLREKDKITSRSLDGVESKPPEWDTDCMESSDGAASTLLEFEGSSGTDTDSEGVFWHPYDLALERRRYNPQLKMERPSSSIDCAQRSNVHPDFSGVLDTPLAQHPSELHLVPTQNPAPSMDLSSASSLWRSRTHASGLFQQQRLRDTFDIGDTQNLCESTWPRYTGDQSRPH